MPLKTPCELSATLFPELKLATRDSAAIRPARQRDRAADWRAQLARAHAYASSQASPAEAEQLAAEYHAALAHGPDFTRYRRNSGFMDAPKLSIDRNAAARIKFMLQAIRRGSWKLKEKGKHAGDIKHSAIEVFDALVRLALKHGQVFPSLVGIAYLSTRSKQTVVNALKVLEFYGFITVHRRIKRIRTALGLKTVQATNAYTIQEPNMLGRASYALFMRERSESRNRAARLPDRYITKTTRNFFDGQVPWEPSWGDLHAQWDTT